MAKVKSSGRANPRVRRALGARIRALRKQRAMSQAKLGDRSGLSGKFIGEVERGEKSISTDSLHLVAAALKVSMAELVAAVDQADVPAEAEQVYALVRGAGPRARKKILRVVEELAA